MCIITAVNTCLIAISNELLGDIDFVSTIQAPTATPKNVTVETKMNKVGEVWTEVPDFLSLPQNRNIYMHTLSINIDIDRYRYFYVKNRNLI